MSEHSSADTASVVSVVLSPLHPSPLSLPAPPIPGVEESSQETNTNAYESNAHLAPGGQPHPAKRAGKRSNMDATSAVSVRDFLLSCCIFCADSDVPTNCVCVYLESNSVSSRSHPNLERYDRSPNPVKANPNPGESRYHQTADWFIMDVFSFTGCRQRFSVLLLPRFIGITPQNLRPCPASV